MSVLENTTNDLRVATMLMKKIGETFQDFQSHSFSILSLSEQWRILQNSIGTIHNSVEERVKAIDSKLREMDMNRIRLQNFKKELEVQQKKLEFEENSLKQRIEGVELREKQVKEWCECLELQRREITERIKAVEVCEKRFSEGLARVKAMDAEEARVSERRKAVEERENEVEKRRRVVENKEVEVEERRKAVEEKEKEVNEMSKMLVSKEKRIRECEEEMDLKKKDIDELRENSLKEVELLENTVNQRMKEVEMREEQINEKFDAFEAKVTQIDEVCNGMEMNQREMEEVKVMEGEKEERRKAAEREPQMDDRCPELNCREKMMNKPRKELTSSAQAKTREPQTVVYSEIQLLCKNMDTNGLRSYLIKHFNYIDMMLAKISDSLQLSPDPAKLVLNVIQSFYELVETEIMPRQMYNAICIALSGVSMKLKTSITLHYKDDVMNFCIRWRDFFTKQGYSHIFDTFAFLQFIAAYKLAQSYDADELLSLLGTFYIKSEGRFLEIDKSFCQILGLDKEIPGFIQPLITREEKLRAIVYICVFKLEDAFPPVPPLKAHLQFIQKRVQEMVKKGSDKAQNDAVIMELSALRALLCCISNFKLESSFSPAPLELHMKQLEKDMEGKVNAESVLTVKKNLAVSEKKGVALPGFDQLHLTVGMKRSLNAMVSLNQGKCLKSRKKSGDASKNTASETVVESTDEEEYEIGKKKENGIAERSDDEKSEQSESEDMKDMSEDDSNEVAPKEKAGSGKANQETIKKTPSVESSGKAASNMVVTHKKARLVPKGTPRKSLINSSKAIQSKDSNPIVLLRYKTKEQRKTEKFFAPGKFATKEKPGKNAVKGKKKSKEDKSKPSDDELRTAIKDILKQIDFNTATFTDVRKQLAKQFSSDLTSRKSLIKLMIEDELTKLSDDDGDER